MSLLVASSAVNALIYIPYAMQLASGWTSLGVYMNVAGLVGAVVLLPPMVSQHGAVGAAGVKLALSLGVFVAGPWIMHRRVLRGEMLRWYLNDVGKPFLAAFSCVAAALAFTTVGWSQLNTITFLLGVLVISSGAACFAGSGMRAAGLSFLTSRFNLLRQAVASGVARQI